MAQLLTEGLRQPLQRLREDIYRVLERFRTRQEDEDQEQAPERFPELALTGPGSSLWAEREPGETRPASVTGDVRVDVQETDDEIVVVAELPGMSKGDFSVEVSEDRVTLRGEKQHAREEQSSRYYFAECSYGTFSRTIMLPTEINPRKAKARYKNGVLRITLPKTAQAKAKRIGVQVQ